MGFGQSLYRLDTSHAVRGGGRGYWQGDEMVTEGSNQLLSAARRKGHGKVVGKEDWTTRGGCMPKMWGGGTDSGPRSVPV